MTSTSSLPAFFLPTGPSTGWHSFLLVPARRPGLVRRHRASSAAAYLIPCGASGDLPYHRHLDYKQGAFTVPPQLPLALTVLTHDNEANDEILELSVTSDGGEDELPTVQLNGGSAKHRLLRRALMQAVRSGQGVALRVHGAATESEWGEERRDVEVLTSPRYLRLASSDAVGRYIRGALGYAVLRLAARKETELPPLAKPEDWHHSEVHEAVRALALHLGHESFDGEWPTQLLPGRFSQALSLLLRARAGGLGVLSNEVETPSKTPRLLVPNALPAAVIAENKDPTRDPRTKLAYLMSVSMSVLSALPYDDDARERLSNTADHIAEYLESDWLRFGPIGAALAQGAIAREYGEFVHTTFKRSGSFEGPWKGAHYRFEKVRPTYPWLALLKRTALGLLGRFVSSMLVYMLLVWLEFSQATVVAVIWFLWGGTLWRLAFAADPFTSGRNRLVVLTMTMREAFYVTFGDFLPVSSLKLALASSTVEGVAWPRELWRLVEDAEERRHTLWNRVTE